MSNSASVVLAITKTTQSCAGDEELAERLLPFAARTSAAQKFPVHAGASYIYEVAQGWETFVLAQDEAVKSASSAIDLEEAMCNTAVKTILVPLESSLSRKMTLLIAARHGQAKTIYFEVDENEQG